MALFVGNLASKVMLLLAEGLAMYALSPAEFGAYSLLQAVVIGASMIAVWGADQALVNYVGASRTQGSSIIEFVSRRHQVVALRSIALIIVGIAVVMLSPASFGWLDYFSAAVIIGVESQLILNAAVFRSMGRGFDAVAFFDGQRHFALLVGALLILTGIIDGTALFVLWAVAGSIACIASHRQVRRLSRNSGTGAELPGLSDHALEISKFSGAWSVVQMVVARLVILASGFLLSPAELGVVAFYMKLMVVFTFLQTLVTQASAPIIGGISKVSRIESAKRAFFLSTFLLAASVMPASAGIILHLPLIERFFTIDNPIPHAASAVFIGAQAVNIGSGIIGQYIIHFGYAKQLLYISFSGVLIQGALLIMLGTLYGPTGVIISYAACNLFLSVAKNVYANFRIGICGFYRDNVLMFAACAIAVSVIAPVVQIQSYPLVHLLAFASFYTAVVVGLALWRREHILDPIMRSLGRG